MKLGARLEAVIDACKIDACNMDAAKGISAADIGCDHGFVSIELVRRGIAGYVLASDIGEGPIASARENIARSGLGDKIETVVADGLCGVVGSEPDLIIISGMGGMLMKKILIEGEAVATQAARLVLSPQSDLYEFRRFLYDSGYHITSENCIRDDGKYYFIICAEPGAVAIPTGTDCKYGRAEHFSCEALKMREEVIRRDLENYKKIREKLCASSTPEAAARLKEIEEEIVLIEEILDEVK